MTLLQHLGKRTGFGTQAAWPSQIEDILAAKKRTRGRKWLEGAINYLLSQQDTESVQLLVGHLVENFYTLRPDHLQ